MRMLSGAILVLAASNVLGTCLVIRGDAVVFSAVVAALLAVVGFALIFWGAATDKRDA